MRSSASIAMSAPAMSSSSSSRSICHERARTESSGSPAVVGQREELLRPGQAALGGVGPVGGDLALVEDVGQRRRVVEPARDAERLLDELLAALRLRRSSTARRPGARAAARAARCRRAAGRCSASSSTATRSSSTMPGERPKPPRLSAARAEQVGVVHAPGELDGGQQRRARRVAARLHLRLPAQEQQLAAAAARRARAAGRGRSAPRRRGRRRARRRAPPAPRARRDGRARAPWPGRRPAPPR